MRYDPKIKPQLWNIHPGTVAYNAQRMGWPENRIKALWPAWEGGGEPYEILTQTKGSFIGTPQWVPSERGLAIDLDGVTERIDYPNLRVINGEPFTVLLWVNVDNITHNGYLFLVESAGGAFNIIFWMYGAANPGRVQLTYATDGTGLVRGDYEVLTANKWYMLAVTYAGGLNYSGIHLYRNGIEVDDYGFNQNGTGNLTAGDGAFILGGRSADNLRCLNGKIGGGIFLNGVLTPAQIVNYYNSDPYGLIRQPDYMELFAAVQAEGVPMSVFMHHYQQIARNT